MKSSTLARHPAFAPTRPARPAAVSRTPAAPPDADEATRQALLARLAHQPWWDGGNSNVFVDHGTVVYQGLVQDRQARRAARALAQALPGVVAVWDARVPRREWQAMA